MKKILSFPLILLVKFYKYVISPHTMRACRYEPSCSTYAIEALQTHGPITGSYLSIKRILSCNPWGNWGYDPVPTKDDLKKNKKKNTQ